MEHNNIDFNTDKVKQCEAVREAVACIYEEDLTFFGPPVITPMTTPVYQVDEKEMLKFREDRRLIRS